MATARCKVCHREMSNPAHIAVGMGPVCAAKALRAGAVRAAREQSAADRVQAVVSDARYSRFVRAYDVLTGWVAEDRVWLDRALRGESDETPDQASAELSRHLHQVARLGRVLMAIEQGRNRAA